MKIPPPIVASLSVIVFLTIKGLQLLIQIPPPLHSALSPEKLFEIIVLSQTSTVLQKFKNIPLPKTTLCPSVSLFFIIFFLTKEYPLPLLI